MNVHTNRFVVVWANQHAQPVAFKYRHSEASKLAARLLNDGAMLGLEREDIEEAIDADLEFYMFQAISKAMMQEDALRLCGNRRPSG
jgi:hypothetical protein